MCVCVLGGGLPSSHTSWALGLPSGLTVSRLEISCLAEEEIVFQVFSWKLKSPCIHQESHKEGERANKLHYKFIDLTI